MFNTFVTMSPVIEPLTLTGKDQEPMLIPFSTSHPIYNVSSFKEFLDNILLNRATQLEMEYAGIDPAEFRDEYYDLSDANFEDFYEDLVAAYQVTVKQNSFGTVDLKSDGGEKVIGARFIDAITFEIFPYHMDFVDTLDDSEETLAAHPNGYAMVEGDAFGCKITVSEGIMNVVSISTSTNNKQYINLNDDSAIELTDKVEKDLDVFIDRVGTELNDPQSNFLVFFNDTALAQVVAFCVLRDNTELLLRYMELHSAYQEMQFAFRYLVTAKKV